MLASPDRSSAHFPLADVPASKETLKYGGFLQRNCKFVVPIHFHQETGIGYVHYTSSHTSISNELMFVQKFC